MRKLCGKAAAILLAALMLLTLFPVTAAAEETELYTDNEWEILVLIYRRVQTDIYRDAYYDDDIIETKQVIYELPDTFRKLSDGRMLVKNVDIQVIDAPLTSVSSAYGWAGCLTVGPGCDVDIDPYLENKLYNEVILFAPVYDYPDGANTGWGGLGGTWYDYRGHPVYIAQIKYCTYSWYGWVYGERYNIGTAAMVHETLHNVQSNSSRRGYWGYEDLHEAVANGYTSENEWFAWYHDMMQNCLISGNQGMQPQAYLVDHYAAPRFEDVADTSYYAEAVNWAVRKGITAGVAPTLFGPKQGCTREQIVTFLWKAAGSPAPTVAGCPFTDVKPGKYYEKPVLWALENDITSGVSHTSFGVRQECTREQAVTFLWKALGSPTPTTETSPFEDVTPGDYYHDAVLWAAEKGITAGVSPECFGVGQTCTRAQIVTFLYKAFSPRT